LTNADLDADLGSPHLGADERRERYGIVGPLGLELEGINTFFTGFSHGANLAYPGSYPIVGQASLPPCNLREIRCEVHCYTVRQHPFSTSVVGANAATSTVRLGSLTIHCRCFQTFKLSQKRALAPAHRRAIRSLRNNDDSPVTRPFWALYGKDAYENLSVCYVLRALTLPANNWRTNLGSSFNSAAARESYLP